MYGCHHEAGVGSNRLAESLKCLSAGVLEGLNNPPRCGVEDANDLIAAIFTLLRPTDEDAVGGRRDGRLERALRPQRGAVDAPALGELKRLKRRGTERHHA